MKNRLNVVLWRKIKDNISSWENVSYKICPDRTLLHDAAINRDIEAIKILLAHQVNNHHVFDINKPDNMGNTPLHFAVMIGDYNTILTLLNSGANASIQNQQHLTPLHEAVSLNLFEISKLLISKMTDVNCMDQNGTTPLHIAVRHNNSGLIKLLLESSADVNFKTTYGWNMIHFTAALHSSQLLEKLVIYTKDINAKDDYGNTALHIASTLNHIDAMRILINYAANVDAKNFNNETALFDAVRNNNLECVKFLLKNGANPYIFNKESKIVLHIAAEFGFANLFDHLYTNWYINNSDWLNMRDIENKTVLDLAKESGNDQIVLCLCSNFLIDENVIKVPIQQNDYLNLNNDLPFTEYGAYVIEIGANSDHT